MVLSLLLLTIRHDTTPPHEKLTLRTILEDRRENTPTFDSIKKYFWTIYRWKCLPFR